MENSLTPKSVSASSSRSLAEKIFLLLFIPSVLAFYSIYKYPQWFGKTVNDFYLWGKSPGFWYSLVYTTLTCGICAWVIFANNNPYWRAKQKKPINVYQRNKFISIFVVQLLVFFLIPYVFVPLFSGHPFWPDSPNKLASKSAHVYVFPAFQSAGMAIYIFVVIPVIVYFFGKRYCSWFCSCGNLAEAVGVTEWG
ncbi:MAG: 4Fe-4S binding protein, partial [Candidatus Caenarcaniphilales bacterium]|nr:4Fe-4S binding protein [Candidatus Caenarcaniphilales bacterium]